jgi:hypothetical protein
MSTLEKKKKKFVFFSFAAALTALAAGSLVGYIMKAKLLPNMLQEQQLSALNVHIYENAL